MKSLICAALFLFALGCSSESLVIRDGTVRHNKKSWKDFWKGGETELYPTDPFLEEPDVER